jgi:hypothetical protein
MSLLGKIRKFQDWARNRGWRIKWISWQEPGKPEYFYNNWMTHILNLLGLGLFFGSIGYMLYRGSENQPVILIIVSVAGLALLFIGRLYAAYNKYKNWVPVKAKCIDQEIKPYVSRGNDKVRTFWGYRLLCKFDFGGKEYTVTPEISRLFSFNSEDKVKEYLSEKIESDKTCRLYIDPENPLHAIFNKKRVI